MSVIMHTLPRIKKERSKKNPRVLSSMQRVNVCVEACIPALSDITTQYVQFTYWYKKASC